MTIGIAANDLVARNSGGLQLVGRPQARPAWYPSDRVRPVRVEVWWRYAGEVAAAAHLVGLYAPGQAVAIPLNPIVDRDLIFSTVTISSDGLRSIRELADATEQGLSYARPPGAAIADDSVTFAKLQNMSAAHLLGRGGAAGPGDPEEIAVGAGLDLSGTTLSAIPPTAAPIADNSVTYAKIQDVSAAARLLGRGGAAGPGDPQELAVGAGLDLSANVLSAIPPTLADNAVTYAKIQDVSAASRLLGRGSAGGPGDPQELTLGAGLALTGQVLSATPPAAPTEYTAKLTNTTAITVPASVLTVLNFNTEVYDAANMRDPTFPSALISRATGKYLVTASVQSPGAASGYFQLRCTKNRAAAGEVVVASQTQANTALAFDCGLSVMLELLVGDFVELLVVHTGPASINLAVLAQTPIFCIAKVF